MLTVEPHPLLELAWLVTRWAGPIGALPEDVALPAPLPPLPEGHEDAVRALLRHGGFKPSGRNKPCNEYIRNAAREGRFPRIHPVVDATNRAVLHGQLPVSTIDLDRATPPLKVAIAPPGSSYPFNAAGQVIDLGGLLCLWDGWGPCANAVKDAQRTKTTPETTRTLSVVWGTTALPGRASAVAGWLAEMHRRLGAVDTLAEPSP